MSKKQRVDLNPRRRRAVGAEVCDEGVHFRVWAPDHDTVHLVLGGGAGEAVAMEREPDGYHSAMVREAAAGTRYRFRPGNRGDLFPDPASRYQPDGPHGASVVVDPGGYRWKYDPPPLDRGNEVIYELHAGTFTAEGSWRGAACELGHLAGLGVTTLELMPVHEFPGSFGWGYDGVGLWAPSHLYGEPDDLRAFVDEAHRHGLAVILDVVYNHFGPDGCYLGRFSKDYFTDRYENDWGESINFDGERSRPVREFFIENAAYWIDEYHFDGLRMDATQSLDDSSTPHVLAEITNAARSAAGREILIVAENEPQDVNLLRPTTSGGHGIDALWNDDFHHSAMVALTGRREAYYTDYLGSPQELISAAKYGFLYQGQRYLWQKNRRGTPTRGFGPHRFITFLENHDQVANSRSGRRLHQLVSPARLRAMTALLLLGPEIPMLFQGQEFASSAPFLYFADHEPELAKKVSAGRREFLAQFPSLATPEAQGQLDDPAGRQTFERCRLDHAERNTNAASVALHRDLLTLRREQQALKNEMDGAVLSAQALAMRWFDPADQDLLLIVNLGAELRLQPAPEPLLAPPLSRRWTTLWSSEWPQYGGAGSPEPETAQGWIIHGEAAVLLRGEPA